MISLCINEVTWVPFFMIAVGLYSSLQWNRAKNSDNPIIKRGSFGFLAAAIGGLIIGTAILLIQFFCY